jgi:UDP-N-acetylglucosamine--N-acetylmuramyl-(pentapeptide) pyrophosphoryl-undecaprenol N-acetylglucosamine transferase
MSDQTTIFLAGGGTGGHLVPGIAVAQALRILMPQAKCVFLCTDKPIDRAILEPSGFEFIPQPIFPFPRSINDHLKFWPSYRQTRALVRQLLRERRPAAVLGLGGYAAGVAVKRSAARKIPCGMLNPDVVPGRANRHLLSSVSAVFCQFEQTAAHIPPAHRSKIRITGCPIRTDLAELPPRAEAQVRLGLDPVLNTLVITGASLGAKTINEAAVEMFKGVTLRGWQVLHLSGKDHAETVRAGYRELSVAARVIDFTSAMNDVWAVADLAISRSGASSCAELSACGVPSILMPYPYHKDMHQRHNADALAAAGAAVVVEDTKDSRKNATALRPILESLLYDGEKRKSMSIAAKTMGNPHAADAVARVMMELMNAKEN